ncbi:MAG TPA: hypothetical protein VNL98_03245 [Gemmatimonadales bacterium]|nr:hypothetical protein [Gemmatimonadales bacterium]
MPKDAVEFLRDRTGRLLSTAPCVWKVEDEFYPEEQGVLAPAPSRWKLAAGYSLSGTVDYGVAYELVRLEPWSLDGVALVQTRSIGAGVARKITANVTVGPALLYSIRDREWALWVVFAGRF